MRSLLTGSGNLRVSLIPATPGVASLAEALGFPSSFGSSCLALFVAGFLGLPQAWNFSALVECNLSCLSRRETMPVVGLHSTTTCDALRLALVPIRNKKEGFLLFPSGF